jgi:uncharacterized protein (TIGR02246 family)
VDKDKKSPKPANLSQHSSEDELPLSGRQSDIPSLEDLYKKLSPEMRRPKPGQDAMAAALEVVQQLAAEAEAEDAGAELARSLAGDGPVVRCRVCGYRNREGNKFCGMCGLRVDPAQSSGARSASDEMQLPSNAPLRSQQPSYEPVANPGEGAPGTHHYHHHYHHHYMPAGQEGSAVRPTPEISRESEKLRSSAVLRGESMSRAEAAVRRITQEWVLACNTKHLDDLLELYVADGLVLRSNYPPVRGAAAIREFFFGALDAGLGEVEVEPIRVEVAGDMAYEAGRCKALVPGATGKRREERGKYLWVFARQSNGEWKLASDCWSSDLTFVAAESDFTSGASGKPGAPRKSA